MYANKPRTIQELKAIIQEEVRALGPEILRTVVENALEKARQLEANNGHHLKDIIFKTQYEHISKYNLHFNKRQH